MLSKNEIINKVKCIDNTVEGSGIVKIENQVVFVSGLLKGEQANIKITRVQKKLAFAKIEKMIKVSPDRKNGVCKSFPMCGGCSILHMDYDSQIKLKAEYVKNNFKKYASADIEIEEIIESPQFEYRNKGSYPINFVDGKYTYGFYRQRTNTIIEHQTCKNQNKDIDNAIRSIVSLLNKNGIDFKLRHIVIRKLDNGLGVLFVTRTQNKKLERFIDTFLSAHYQLISINVNTSPGNKIIDGEIIDIAKKDAPIVTLNGLKFNVSHNAFFQVNDFNTEKLYEAALCELNDANEVLELYSGTGTISCLASKKANHITAVEIVKEAVEDANKNKKLNDISNIDFQCEDASKFLEKSDLKFDSLIVDPPRKGLNQSSYEHILKANPEQIIYISCSSDTLARDYLNLSEQYKIKKLKIVDMFPNTKHIESILVLEKK